jgi:alkylation response protein AidB-like acyl-CoA dehydrogenase
MFAEAIEAILAHHCTPAVVRAIEAGGSAQPLADAIAESGFLELLATEERGGGALGWRDFFDVVTLLGAWAVPLPLAQTMASRRLARGDDELPPGQITFAPQLARGSNRGLHAANVPFARTTQHVIGALDDGLVLLPVAAARLQPNGIHGSLAASLHWSNAEPRKLGSGMPAQQFQAIAALIHAGLLAGAIKRSFDITMQYANERVQFGKSIGKFQAIQHQLSAMAEHAAASRMAAEAAFAAGEPLPTLTACAVAKARTSEAAQLVASIAHGVHGAVGVTEEYDLQVFTRRLHEWRIAHGSESHWHRVLGQLFLDSKVPLAADFARSLC